MITSNNHSSNGSEFVISNYLSLLGEKSKEGKYACPVCEGHNLSIHKDGKKYTCYDGCEAKKIAYILRKQNGEFKSKKQNNQESTLQRFKPDSTSVIVYNNSNKSKLRTAMEVQDFLDNSYLNRIAYNLRFDEIEIDGQVLIMDCVRATMSRKHRLDISAELLRECLLEIALRNKYDPVKNYFDSLDLSRAEDLTAFAAGILHVHDDLHLTYIRKWLIGCVARIYEAGCKFDEVLILQGKQGIGKSSFFQFMSNGWFSDSMTGNLDVNDLRIMKANWILEWGELDGYTAKQYNAKIKRFLSAQDDTYRLPYGRDMTRVPRRSVIVGTTNRDDFLKDPTGNRRFWIVPVTKEIDLPLVKGLRDVVWAGAIKAYRSGEDWKLPRELWKFQAEDNLNYEQSDPWEDFLIEYLKTQEGSVVFTSELLKKLENFGVKVNYTRTDEMRVADLVKKQGWKRTKVTRNSQQIRGWKKSN